MFLASVFGKIGGKIVSKSTRVTTSAMLVASCVLLASCGSGTNNDQGNSVSLIGFRNITEEGEIQCDVERFGAVVLLGVNGPDISLLNTATVALAVQNNLDGQTFRTERYVLQYIVPGATIQPPLTSFPVGTVIPPFTNSNSTLPGSGQGGGSNPACPAISLVSSEIVQWLSLNRASLPEAPYTLEAYVTVRGVTSAGRVIDTNRLGFEVNVLPEELFNGTPGVDAPIPPEIPSGQQLVTDGSVTDGSDVSGDLGL